MQNKKCCFTLAEVLITLAIIGVVAALTIPTLISKISQKAKEARTEVIEKRLLDGLNRARTGEDILTQSYENTEEFLKKLGAYYKMSSICGAENIQDCLPEGTIHMKGDNDEITDIEVSDLNTAAALGKDGDEWHAPAAFISAQGTPFVISLNKKCIRDTGEAIKGIPQDCVALFYDRNGTTGPNMLGEDIITHGLTVLPPNKELPTLATLGGVKIKSEAFEPTSIPITGDNGYCTESDGTYTVKQEYKDLGITECCTSAGCKSNGDYWVGAMKTCHDADLRLPNNDELTAIAQDLYNDDTIPVDDCKDALTYDNSKVPETLSDMQISGSFWFFLWSSEEYGAHYAYNRFFDASFSSYCYGDRDISSNRALCVGD